MNEYQRSTHTTALRLGTAEAEQVLQQQQLLSCIGCKSSQTWCVALPGSEPALGVEPPTFRCSGDRVAASGGS
jgi:hypothetical protein